MLRGRKWWVNYHFHLKSDSPPRDSWIRHVRWNVAGTVSQMRQRLRHRGPAVPKSITPPMEQCSGNAQCLTMDTNCWLTWKLWSALIYNLTSKVLQWPLCVCTVKLNMTTGKWEQILASTKVIVLACMQAHHARMENTLLMNIKNNDTNVTALLKTSFGRQKLVQQGSRFMSETKLHLCGNRYSSEGEGRPCLDFPLLSQRPCVSCQFVDMPLW